MQHRQGSFKNTHVKRETLLEFVNLYDEFIQDLFCYIEDDEQGLMFKYAWNTQFRITDRHLARSSLKDIVHDIKYGYESDARRRDRQLEI
jgi:hypothetical protein